VCSVQHSLDTYIELALESSLVSTSQHKWYIVSGDRWMVYIVINEENFDC